MNKEFIPYEQALDLKELGFDEPCFGNWQDMKEETPWFSKSYADNQNQYYGQLCSAPTFSQAFRWFREKYGLDHEISYAGIKGEYHAFVREYVYGNNGNSPSVFSYEEAELECLKKLIKIVKDEIQTNQ